MSRDLRPTREKLITCHTDAEATSKQGKATWRKQELFLEKEISKNLLISSEIEDVAPMKQKWGALKKEHSENKV